MRTDFSISLATTFLMTIVIAGCASSPPVRFYRLEPLSQPVVSDRPSTEILALGPLVFPDYLKRPQIVSRGDDASMVIDEFNRWIEPLDDAVPRILALNVDALLEDYSAIPFSSGSARASVRVFGNIHQLDADPSGRMIFSVQWGAVRSNGELMVPPRTERYEASARPPAEPSAIAVAVSSVLASFSRDIAATVRAATVEATQSPSTRASTMTK